MGLPKKPEEALLFQAIAIRPDVEQHWLEQNIFPYFGKPYKKSAPFLFSYSKYYEPEMGAHLKKFFVVYEGLYSIEEAVSTKLKAVELEQKYAPEGRRIINIDPGYLTLAKLVLTTTKNYDHRIYLSRGIYADVQLRFRKGRYVFNPWTYPDYQDEDNLEFFYQARNYLYGLIKAHETQL